MARHRLTPRSASVLSNGLGLVALAGAIPLAVHGNYQMRAWGRACPPPSQAYPTLAGVVLLVIGSVPIAIAAFGPPTKTDRLRVGGILGLLAIVVTLYALVATASAICGTGE